MATPKPDAKGAAKGVKDRLTAKVGPLPVYAWAIIAVGAYYLYTRYKSSNSVANGVTPSTSQTSGATGTAADTSGTGGGSAGGSSSGDSGYNGTNDLLSQLLLGQAGLSADLAAFSAPSQTLTTAAQGTPAGQPESSPAPQPAVSSNPVGSAVNPNLGLGSGLVYGNGGSGSYDVGGTSVTPIEKPFGGVTSVKTLKNGATLTTYASGHQVEQAKGKAPYVVKK